MQTECVGHISVALQVLVHQSEIAGMEKKKAAAAAREVLPCVFSQTGPENLEQCYK